jgi:hypothetical protein
MPPGPWLAPATAHIMLLSSCRRLAPPSSAAWFLLRRRATAITSLARRRRTLASASAPRLAPKHLQGYTPIGDVDAADADTVLQANASLLGAISSMDWEAYGALCADDISCFEVEAGAQQVV